MMDSGEYQVAVWRFPHLGLGDRPADLVRVHPVYLALARAVAGVPVGTFAGRVNFASALFGAVAVANASLLALRFTRRRRSAALAALVAALGHTLWAFAVIAEVLTLMAALLSAELLCWERFARTRGRVWLLLLAALNGLGVATHLQLGLTSPIYAVALIVLWRRGALSMRFLFGWAGVWLLATAPYSGMVLYYAGPTGDWLFVLRSATRGRFGATPGMIRPATIARGAAAMLLNYPTLLLLLAAGGARRVWRTLDADVARWVLPAAAAVQLCFALTYAVPDQYSFFVPFYAVAAALIGIGGDRLMSRRTWRVALPLLALAAVPIYAAAPRLMRAARVRFFGRAVPYRDPYDFFLRPWKTGDRGQRRYVGEAFAQLPRDAVLLTSFTMRPMLEYGQRVDGLRGDVTLVDGAAELLPILGAAGWTRPVFANDAEAGDFPAVIRANCALERAGWLWRIAPPTDRAAFMRAVEALARRD
ncbi:MAG: DUF2723 domain-containing protein [Phycisphaerae bacterium]